MNNTSKTLIFIVISVFIVTMSSCTYRKTDLEILNEKIRVEDSIRQDSFIKERQIKFFKAIEVEVVPKSEKTIEKLGYTRISSVGLDRNSNEYNAQTSCPVKKTTFVIGEDGAYKEGVEDKAYMMYIFFTKYEEYEIVKVELLDTGNGYVQILE